MEHYIDGYTAVEFPDRDPIFREKNYTGAKTLQLQLLSISCRSFYLLHELQKWRTKNVKTLNWNTQI